MSETRRARIHSAGRRHIGATRSLGLALVLLLTASGCVQRQLTIRTNPPGAFVYIDDTQIGVTPCSTPYTYYGTRKVRIVKDGFETLTTYQKFPAPWYAWPGIDFFSENLYPGEIRDDRTISFQLEPQKVVAPLEVIARGENLRQGTRMDGLTPPGVMVTAPDGTPIGPQGSCPPGFMSKPPCPANPEPPRMVPFAGE